MHAILIDDHSLFCEGVRLLVQYRLPQLTLHVAHDLADAMRQLHEQPEIGLALLDLALPDAAGLQGLARLRQGLPHVSVIVVSADERPETVIAAIDHGAAGYIPKTADSSVFCDALVTVLDGRVPLPVQALAPSSSPAEGSPLTPRQLEVLRLLVQGRSNKLIMRELGLSESTVKTHLEKIFERLSVSSRTQAVVAAARLGLRLGA